MKDNTQKFIKNISNIKDLEQISQDLVKRFNSPQLVLLKGDLGSGKTQAVRFMCLALGVPSHNIQSPSFSYINKYNIDSEGFKKGQNSDGKLNQDKAIQNEKTDHINQSIYHVDLFRIKEGEDLNLKGFWDLFHEPVKVLFIEWSDRLKDPLPSWPTLSLFFNVSAKERTLEGEWF